MVALVTNDDMTGFPGAPYSDGVLEAAAESVRDDCGWHIAPALTETIEVESTGPIVFLPSLLVSAVSAVRNARTGDLVEDWRLDKRAGVLSRNCGWWPVVVEVDLTHGYDDCPPALKPTIADRARAMAQGGYVRQESLGSRSISLSPLESAVARYALPPRP